MSSSKTETAKLKRLKREDLKDNLFKWCTLEEFSKEAPKNQLVRPFSFTAGAVKGSVSPGLKLCVAGPMCHITFMSLFMHAFSTHLSGLTWKGRIERRDLCISKSMQLCAILRKTVKLTCDEDMVSDILSIISNCEPLYTINGFWPPYYAEMISRLKEPPPRSNPKALQVFHKNVLKRPGLSTPEGRSHVVQEFYSNTVEFKYPDWETFNRSAPINLQDWMHITKVDKRLTKVKDESHGMGPQFGRQSHYMRHLVVHAPDDREKKKKRKKACDDEDASDDEVASDDEEIELDDEKKEGLLGNELWPPLTKAPAPLAASASAQADVSAPPRPRPPKIRKAPAASASAQADVSARKPIRKAHASLTASARAQRDPHPRKPTIRKVEFGDFLSPALEKKGYSASATPPPPPPTKELWDITERDMLGHYYFREFMATFVDHMYKEKDNQEFMGKICSSYENGLPKLGCITHEMIPPEFLEELEGSEDEQEMEEG